MLPWLSIAWGSSLDGLPGFRFEAVSSGGNKTSVFRKVTMLS
jgi:hypothetical protein